MEKKNGRLKNAFYSSLSSAIYQIIAIICGFIVSKLIIQNYGSSWNGVLSSITKFLGLFSIVEVGVSGATRVALYKSFAENDGDKTSSIIRANDIFYKKVSIVLLFYIILLAIAMPYIIHSDFDRIAISVMVLIIGISNFAENCWGINSKILLMASQKRYIVNVSLIISTIANTLLLVLIVRLGGSIHLAKAGSGVVYTIIPISLYIVTRKMFRINRSSKPDDSALKGRWDVLANSLSNIVHENVDIFFLSIFCASTEVSVYSLYYVVAGGLTKVFNVIINGVEAGFGNMWVKGELNNLKRNLSYFEFIMTSAAVLLFGSMMVLIVPFMSIYMNGVTDVNYQRFALGVTIGIAQILLSIRTPYVLLVQSAGHYKQVKIGAFVEALLNIILTWALVVRYGIVGAIVGTIVANAFRTIQYGWYISKKMINRSFMNIIGRFAWTFFNLGFAFFVAKWIIRYVYVEDWIGWIIKACIVFLVHCIVLLIGSLIFYKDDFFGCINMINRIRK